MTKAVCVLWAIALPLAYYWGASVFSPAELANWLKLIVMVGLCFPTLIIAGAYLQFFPDQLRKAGHQYFLSFKGAGWQGRGTVSWKRIESYRFTDHAQLPGIRVLQFKVKSVKAGVTILEGHWWDFDFNPAITPEAEIESLLHHYLPPA